MFRFSLSFVLATIGRRMVTIVPIFIVFFALRSFCKELAEFSPHSGKCVIQHVSRQSRVSSMGETRPSPRVVASRSSIDDVGFVACLLRADKVASDLNVTLGPGDRFVPVSCESIFLRAVPANVANPKSPTRPKNNRLGNSRIGLVGGANFVFDSMTIHQDTCSGLTCWTTCGLETYDGGTTCTSTCGDEWTCALALTCQNVSTCDFVTDTCNQNETCTFVVTCDLGNTCDFSPTCSRQETCEGYGDTCDGGSTCTNMSTCQGGETCDNSDTCFDTTTCVSNTCVWETCSYGDTVSVRYKHS